MKCSVAVYQLQAGEGDCAEQQLDPQEIWEELSSGEVQGAIYIIQYAGGLRSLAQMGDKTHAVCPTYFFLLQGQRNLHRVRHKWQKMWRFPPLVEASLFPFPSHAGLGTFSPLSIFIM